MQVQQTETWPSTASANATHSTAPPCTACSIMKTGKQAGVGGEEREAATDAHILYRHNVLLYPTSGKKDRTRRPTCNASDGSKPTRRDEADVVVVYQVLLYALVPALSNCFRSGFSTAN